MAFGSWHLAHGIPLMAFEWGRGPALIVEEIAERRISGAPQEPLRPHLSD
jgi:hypothetical protein